MQRRSPEEQPISTLNRCRWVSQSPFGAPMAHNAGHHRREWRAAKFPSVCMAWLSESVPLLEDSWAYFFTISKSPVLPFVSYQVPTMRQFPSTLARTPVITPT